MREAVDTPQERLRLTLAELLLASCTVLQKLQIGEDRARLRDAVLAGVRTLEETRQ